MWVGQNHIIEKEHMQKVFILMIIALKQRDLVLTSSKSNKLSLLGLDATWSTVRSQTKFIRLPRATSFPWCWNTYKALKRQWAQRLVPISLGCHIFAQPREGQKPIIIAGEARREFELYQEWIKFEGKNS